MKFKDPVVYLEYPAWYNFCSTAPTSGRWVRSTKFSRRRPGWERCDPEIL